MTDPTPEYRAGKATDGRQTDGVLPIIPLRDLLLFPGMIHPLSVRRPASVAAAQAAIRANGKLGLLLQRQPATEEPAPDDLYGVGTVVNILRYVTGPDNAHHLVCQGDTRFRVTEFAHTRPHLAARFELPEEIPGNED